MVKIVTVTMIMIARETYKMTQIMEKIQNTNTKITEMKTNRV